MPFSFFATSLIIASIRPEWASFISSSEGFSPVNLIELQKRIKNQEDIIYAIEGTKTYTIITSEKHQELVEKNFKKQIIKLTKNQAMIIMKNPQGVEETPGFTSYLYHRFGEYGVNILETMSCWKDTIFVISEEDIATTMKFLKFWTRKIHIIYIYYQWPIGD